MGKEAVEAAISVLEDSLRTIDTWVLIFAAAVAFSLTVEVVFSVAHWVKERQLAPLRTQLAVLNAGELKDRDERVAKAEKETADAQLALLRLQMPRGINMEKFNELIAGIPPASVEVMYDANAPDAASLASAIWGFLFNAKWPVQPSTGATPLLAPPPNMLPWSQMPWTQAAGASPWGVSVLTSEPLESAVKNVSWRGLFDALAKSIDGQVISSAPAQGTMRAGVLRIVVGPKHP